MNLQYCSWVPAVGLAIHRKRSTKHTKVHEERLVNLSSVFVDRVLSRFVEANAGLAAAQRRQYRNLTVPTKCRLEHFFAPHVLIVEEYIDVRSQRALFVNYAVA
jgi:hypothetical protein